MRESNWKAVIDAAMQAAVPYLESLPTRRVYNPAEAAEIRDRVGGPLPEKGTPPEDVVALLGRDLEPFVTSHASGRFFGFVIGGLHPASYGADLLTASWDQNAGLFAVTPGVAVVEDVARGWLLELLDLPRDASIGFVTGGQMANFTCLAAARDAVLRDAGWDVEADGLQAAPRVNVVVKSERHSTVARALRYLGLGFSNATEVPSDSEGRIDSGELDRTLRNLNGPTIVCVEAGNINSGSFDPFGAVADLAEAHRARGNPTWVHVDGAIGLWARACRDRARLTEDLDRLDSWSTDAHKLLNVSYDSGIAICRDAPAHRAAMGVQAAYLMHSGTEERRDPMDWNPEFSRRARGLAIYATLKSLGREGVDALVERTCRLARLFADALSSSGRAKVLNEVVFNQVLVQWQTDGDANAYNDLVIERVQRGGTAFFSGTTANGMRMMRISVSDWATDEEDVDRALAALIEAATPVDLTSP